MISKNRGISTRYRLEKKRSATFYRGGPILASAVSGVEHALGVLIRLVPDPVEALQPVARVRVLPLDLPKAAQKEEGRPRQQQRDPQIRQGQGVPRDDVVHRPDELRKRQGEEGGDAVAPPALQPEVPLHFPEARQRLGAAPACRGVRREAAQGGQLLQTAVSGDQLAGGGVPGLFLQLLFDDPAGLIQLVTVGQLVQKQGGKHADLFFHARLPLRVRLWRCKQNLSTGNHSEKGPLRQGILRKESGFFPTADV